MSSNPFSPPASELVEQEREATAVPDVADQEVLRASAYLLFAKNDYYLQAWRQLIRGTGNNSSYNVYAAIFGSGWCFYRKLYWLGALVIASTLLCGFVIGFALAALLPNGQIAEGGGRIVGTIAVVLFVRIPLGFYANEKYFKHATHEISSAVKAGGGDEAIRQRISSRGGVSNIGAIAAIIVGLLLNAIISKMA